MFSNKVQDVQREIPPEVENIPSNNEIDEHHQSCLHIRTNAHPPSKIIRSPSTCVRTRSSDDLTKLCHYAAFMSSTEPRTIKDTLLDHD